MGKMLRKAATSPSSYGREELRDTLAALTVLISAAIPRAERAMPLKKTTATTTTTTSKADFDWSHLRQPFLDGIKGLLAMETLDEQIICSEATGQVLFG